MFDSPFDDLLLATVVQNWTALENIRGWFLWLLEVGGIRSETTQSWLDHLPDDGFDVGFVLRNVTGHHAKTAGWSPKSTRIQSGFMQVLRLDMRCIVSKVFLGELGKSRQRKDFLSFYQLFEQQLVLCEIEVKEREWALPLFAVLAADHNTNPVYILTLPALHTRN